MPDLINKLITKIQIFHKKKEEKNTERTPESEVTASETSAEAPAPADGNKPNKLSAKQKLLIIIDDCLNCFYDKRATGAAVFLMAFLGDVFMNIYNIVHSGLDVPTVFFLLMSVFLFIGLFGLVFGKDVIEDENLDIRIAGEKVEPWWFWSFIAAFGVILILYILIAIGFH